MSAATSSRVRAIAPALGSGTKGSSPPICQAPRQRVLGLPFSVDDGRDTFALPTKSIIVRHDAAFPAPLATSPEPLRAGLGPLLPLPLILQRGNTSTIVEQPTDLRLLTSRLLDHATTFVKAHRGERWFIYFAFGHVHTATAAISPDRRYAGCRRRDDRPAVY